MTTSDHAKVLKQLDKKPAVRAKYLKFNKPKDRSCGSARRSCRRCGRTGGHIRKYKLGFCRQCFRHLAQMLGFKKYS